MNGRPDWVEKISQLRALVGAPQCEVLICPPHGLVGAMAMAAHGTLVAIGGQDCSNHEAGAHTGETDAELLASLGATYVILGHSERRTMGETDALIKAKAERAIACGLRPIVCVGESLDQREGGEAVSVVLSQLEKSLPETDAYDIAYEPIWAIGTGKTATADDVAEMHGAIREAVGSDSRILYGGSVKPANAEELLGVEEVGGALVGGASLKMESFSQIIEAAQ